MLVDITRPADADMKSIARFTRRRWGEEQSARYMKAISDRLKQLSRHPKLGTVRRELSGEPRGLLSGSHVIFYRLTPQAVVIVRILHQAMDASLHIEGE